MILKLAAEGDTHTGRIIGCSEVAGNFGPQVKFTFEGGDDLYLPKESADRQLQRIPLAYAECVGEVLTFSRDHNPKVASKPYWGVKLAAAGDNQPKPSGKRVPPPGGISKGAIPGLDDEGLPPELTEDESPYDNPGPIPPFHKPSVAPVAPVAQEKAKIVRAYLDLFAWMRTQPEVKDVPLDVVQSISATVWIEWNKRGLVK